MRSGTGYPSEATQSCSRIEVFTVAVRGKPTPVPLQDNLSAHSADLMLQAQQTGRQSLHGTGAPHLQAPATKSLFRHACFRSRQRHRQPKRPQFRLQASFSAFSTCQCKRDERFTCKALAAPLTPPAQNIVDIPFGDTAGANLIMENVTVQAGHRDLLEVRLSRLHAGTM